MSTTEQPAAEKERTLFALKISHLVVDVMRISNSKQREQIL